MLMARAVQGDERSVMSHDIALYLDFVERVHERHELDFMSPVCGGARFYHCSQSFCASATRDVEIQSEIAASGYGEGEQMWHASVLVRRKARSSELLFLMAWRAHRGASAALNEEERVKAFIAQIEETFVEADGAGVNRKHCCEIDTKCVAILNTLRI